MINYYNTYKKSLILISAGLANLIHAIFHILQVFQSYLLFKSNTNRDFAHYLMDNPYMSIIWAIIGIATLLIGVRDFIHHKKCQKH